MPPFMFGESWPPKTALANKILGFQLPRYRQACNLYIIAMVKQTLQDQPDEAA